MNTNINQSMMLPMKCILRGIYRIERYLSSGGFGNTYVATNMEFEETVAIKEFFIRGITQRDDNNTTVSVGIGENKELFDEQLMKFKKEARRLRKLKNKHIVSVHDLFEENGTAYYVMDYIEGENLSDKLKRRGAPLNEDEVMGLYMPQLIDALDCVHQQGLWHLDLKPANIMVDRNGNVCLIDFGASKQRNVSGGATSSTSVSYTNGFAPLEQMEQRMDKFGPWTDIYALGATLYNLLSYKRPPMPSDIDDDMTEDKHLALPFPKNVSAKTKQLILRMLTSNRLKRPQSVQEVMDMIGAEPIVSHDEIKPIIEDPTRHNNIQEEGDNVIQKVALQEETLLQNYQQGESHETTNISRIKQEGHDAKEDNNEINDKIKEKNPLLKKLLMPLIAAAVLAAVIAIVLHQGKKEEGIPADEEQLFLSQESALTILIEKDDHGKGRILLEINRLDDRENILENMLICTNEELEAFKGYDTFGASYNELRNYLELPANQRPAMPKTGIPLDSINWGMSEFEQWIVAALICNREIKIEVEVAAGLEDDTYVRVMRQLSDLSLLNDDGSINNDRTPTEPIELPADELPDEPIEL